VSPSKDKAKAPAKDKTEASEPKKLVVAVDSLCVGGILTRKPKGTLLSAVAVQRLEKGKHLEDLEKKKALMSPEDFKAKLEAEAAAKAQKSEDDSPSP
jgi:hypothetical protein